MRNMQKPAVSEDRAEEHCRDACPDWECEKAYRFVIYSTAELGVSEGQACFWSNDEGWTSLDGATRFTFPETKKLSLPIAHGQTAVWMLLENAKTMNVHKFIESRCLQTQ